jgi:hypothetical protein
MANEIISYLEMCSREGTSLQRGMNIGLGGDLSPRPGTKGEPQHVKALNRNSRE